MPRNTKTKKLERVPTFRSEAEEREFWATHDTANYIDWSGARRAVFPDLRPSTETISLRLPSHLLADLKALANERDVPYQSLLKVLLAEQVRREQRLAQRTPDRRGAHPPTRRRRKRAPAE
jgi:predicted DNA binding CopG/RHH family protein